MSSLILPATSSRELVLRALRARWQWILTGVVVGLLVSGVYLLIAPHEAIATTTVNVVAVNSEDSGSSARSAASIVDMPTEIELAKSAITAQAAVQRLGDGWDQTALMEGTSVSGDSGGTVLRISYRDRQTDRARAGADAISDAYLEARSSLAKTRFNNRVSTIDARIAALEKELSEVTEDAGRTATLRSGIAELVSQRSTLNDPTIEAGQIISSAEQAAIKTTPASRLVLVAGALIGAFLGLVVLFLRGLISNRITSGSDLAELLRLPVWLPEQVDFQQDAEETGLSSQLDQTTNLFAADLAFAGRWASAIELVLSLTDASPLLLILDPDSPDTDEVYLTLKSAIERARGGVSGSHLEVVDVSGPRWKVIRAAATAPVCILALSSDFKKSEIVELTDQVEMTGCRSLGALLLSSGHTRMVGR